MDPSTPSPTPAETNSPISDQTSNTRGWYFWVIILVVIGLLIVVGVLIFRFWMGNSSVPTLTKQAESSSSVPDQPRTDLDSSVWTIASSTDTDCKVSIPMPPKSGEFTEQINGKTYSWQYIKSNGANIDGLTFAKSSSAVYTDNLSNGQVLAEVQVNCSVNDKGYDTQAFADIISDSIEKWTSFKGEKVSCPNPHQSRPPLWGGEDVIAIEATCTILDSDEKRAISSSYYLVATTNRVYLISKLSDSENIKVDDAMHRIFETIQFTN